MKSCAADAARGQPLKWPTSNKSYRPLTILGLRLQFSLGNRFLKGTDWSTPVDEAHQLQECNSMSLTAGTPEHPD